MFVQDSAKVESAINMKDSRYKQGKNYQVIQIDLREPY